MGILPMSRSLIKAPPTFLLFYLFTLLLFYYAFFSLCITLPLP